MSFNSTKNITWMCLCRKLNNHTIKINQTSYRTFRIDPLVICYLNICIDYLGHFTVTIRGEICKIHILLLSCLYYTSVNLQICLDLSLPDFLELFICMFLNMACKSSQVQTSCHPTSKPWKYYCWSERKWNKVCEIFTVSQGHKWTGDLLEILLKLVKILLNASIRRFILSFFRIRIICSWSKPSRK